MSTGYQPRVGDNSSAKNSDETENKTLPSGNIDELTSDTRQSTQYTVEAHYDSYVGSPPPEEPLYSRDSRHNIQFVWHRSILNLAVSSINNQKKTYFQRIGVIIAKITV